MILRDMFNQSIQGGIDNMDEIEKLQNIIFRECDIDRGTQWESLKRIARFVMRREIEARMNEHDKICGVCKDLKTPCFRLAELRKQLKDVD